MWVIDIFSRVVTGKNFTKNALIIEKKLLT